MSQQNYSILEVKVTQDGDFYKCFVNGKQFSKDELFMLLDIEFQKGMRLEYYLDIFKKNNPNWVVEYSEVDVS